MNCAGDDDERTQTPMLVFGSGAQMSVSSFESADAAAGYVSSNAIVVSAEPPTISGHLAVGSCVDLGPELRSCDSRWWQDAVMITLSVAGDPTEVEAATVDQALVALVPVVVDQLAS